MATLHVRAPVAPFRSGLFSHCFVSVSRLLKERFRISGRVFDLSVRKLQESLLYEFKNQHVDTLQNGNCEYASLRLPRDDDLFLLSCA